MGMDIKSNFQNIELYFDSDWSFKTISEADVQHVEQMLGFKFPQAIKDFYLRFNGMQLVVNCCIALGDSYIKVGDFNEINAENQGMDFIEMYKVGLTEFWPDHLIPFAYDEGAHEFCFSIDTNDFGAIYFHNSEWTGEPEEIQFLAKDFLSFLAALRPESRPFKFPCN